MLLFLHIPKTAGTSLLISLAEAFGNRLMPVPFDASNPYKPTGYPWRNSVSPQDHNRKFDVAAAIKYDCVAGHFDWGVRELLPTSQVITLLREPISRTISQFRHACRWAERVRQTHADEKLVTTSEWSRTLPGGLAGELNIEAFLASGLFDNPQTRLLTGTLWSEDRPADDESLKQAKRNLADCTFGLTEDYSAAISRINRKFRLQLPIHYANSARESPPPLTSHELACIEQHNELDSELYAWAARQLALSNS